MTIKVIIVYCQIMVLFPNPFSFIYLFIPTVVNAAKDGDK